MKEIRKHYDLFVKNLKKECFILSDKQEIEINDYLNGFKFKSYRS